jgi:prevent-host-death family protein
MRAAPKRPRRSKNIETTFPATLAKREFGRVLDAALQKGKVEITRHGKARAVVLSIEAYEALAQRSAASNLDALRAEWDAMFENMQTAAAQKAYSALFKATPEDLGKAAVWWARQGG